MNKFNLFIFLIIMMKILFIFLSIITIHFKNKKPENKNLIFQLDYWKMRVEFVFVIMMSILLIYLFNPRANNLYLITNETKLLLYLFGFLLIITAKWSDFFKESSWFLTLQKVIST